MQIDVNAPLVSFDPTRRQERHEKWPSVEGLGLEGDFTFKYSYPLRNGAAFTHELSPLVSAIEILEHAKADYISIYAAEDAAVGHTPNIPGMLNGASSSGPYGIWGHCISDLFFEAIKIDLATRTITFEMGS